MYQHPAIHLGVEGIGEGFFFFFFFVSSRPPLVFPSIKR